MLTPTNKSWTNHKNARPITDLTHLKIDLSFQILQHRILIQLQLKTKQLT